MNPNERKITRIISDPPTPYWVRLAGYGRNMIAYWVLEVEYEDSKGEKGEEILWFDTKDEGMKVKIGDIYEKHR